MWLEKSIATAQRHGITVVDTSRKRAYDLRSPGDEAAFPAPAVAALSLRWHFPHLDG
jgi:hypothetical protein